MSKAQELAQCAGYSVETHEGRIGSVVAVLPRAERSAPGVLVMHSGLVGCGLVVVPFEQIEAVDHGHKRLLLRDKPVTLQQGAPPGARDQIPTCA